MLRYGVLVDGEFEERAIYQKLGKGFATPLWLRENTYDEYVMKEIPRSYGMLEVKDKVVLDIGANIGAFSVWARDHGAQCVWSIEPELNNFHMLSRNAVLGQIVTVNAALTPDHDGELTLYLAPSGKNPGNSSTTPRRGRTEVVVPAMSVNSLLKQFNVENPPTVAKIDCEGAEYDLLPELMNIGLEQMALEYHIQGFGLEPALEAHQRFLAAGWEVVRAPVLDNPGLWQTLAAYRRE